MDRPSGVTTSPWMKYSSVRCTRHSLPPRSRVDVCVVGGGITGLSAAYHLLRAGKTVVVLESGSLGSGETGRTSAHLSCVLDEGFVKLEKLHGPEGARIAAESHAQAIDAIEHIVATEGIECGFTRLDGYLFMGPEDDRASLEAEAAASRRAGLTVEWLDQPVGPPLAAGPSLRYPRQAQFDPLRYLQGLVWAIERRGGLIYEHAHVEKFHSGTPTRAVVQTGEEVEANALLVCTNTPVNDRFVLHAKQSPHRTYALSLAIAADAIPLGLYWDRDEPYHYVRVDPTPLLGADGRADGRVSVIVGGADHRTGEGDDPRARWDHLESWARAHIEPAGEVIDRWSGQCFEPADGLAFIGKNPADGAGVFIATGDSGHGLTHGTIAAILFTEMVAGRSHPWETLYDPRRITARALGTMAKDNLEGLAHLGDWFSRPDVPSEVGIEHGEGATVMDGLRRLAVYRDTEGVCHRFSAACPHLGGALVWNPAEKSWDCPLHGSRFDVEGRVICGPARDDLTPADEDAPPAHGARSLAEEQAGIGVARTPSLLGTRRDEPTEKRS